MRGHSRLAATARSPRSAAKQCSTLALVALLVCALGAPAGGEVPPDEEAQAFYLLGVLVGRDMAKTWRLTDAELEHVKVGLLEGARGQAPEFENETWDPKLQALLAERRKDAAEEEAIASESFLAIAAHQPGAVRQESGLIISEIKAGEGTSPSVSDVVVVHYHGTFRDGTVLDSSVQRGKPATIRLSNTIRCWQEGVPLMKVGGTSKLVCPAEIAYGPTGQPPRIPGGAALSFEVELIDIVQPEAVAPSP